MNERIGILIVDDEPHIRRILQVAFEKEGYSVWIAEDAHKAMGAVKEHSPHVVLTDVTMPGKTGYELLREIKDFAPDIQVVIMTAYGTIPAAVQSIREGAFEYVTKPFDIESLKRVVASALEEAATPMSAPTATKRLPKKKGKTFIAESPAMLEILETIEQVADSRATVLITGESGTGKEVIARALHDLSVRKDHAFVAVSCAALPETLLESELFGYEKGAFTGANGSKAGRFELADNGTLFMDEIGEIPLATQVKLLRVLQEREFERLGGSKPTRVDVRLLAATNRELMEAVDQGVFRLDLYYRLQVVEIFIPPLREREQDILPLARHFLEKFCAENERTKLDVSIEAERVLTDYRWPGNVRELENMMERVVVLAPREAEEISLKMLPPTLKKAA
ncbi:MAG: sigma-54-dependent Fis family transcriptional regulator [Fimbriimonadaceae bacterium]|nr:sigma-54-dependent Fis family transcriptional regulator [Fimbriimonadaceae bacterium]